MSNFASYSNMQDIMTAIGQKFAEVNGAYVFKGTKTFAQLPSTLTAAMTGYTYNMSEEFTTDSRFVEGAGKKYPAGTNVTVANLGDDTTPDMKFDVVGSFVDVDAIMAAIDAVSDMIAGEFDDTAAYVVGDVVVYDGALYKFTSAHTAGDWDATEATEVTVVDLIAAVASDVSSVNSRVNSVVGDLADAFDTATAYTTGDVVIYNDQLYKFTADKAAGAWDSTKVSATTVEALVNAAEPEELTSAQVQALIALL